MKKKLFESIGGNMFKINENSATSTAEVDAELVKRAMKELPKCNPTKTKEGTRIAGKITGRKSGVYLYKLDNGNHAIKSSDFSTHWVFETDADKLEYEKKLAAAAADDGLGDIF